MSSNELFYKYFLLVIYLSFIWNWLCLLFNELAMTQNLCKVVFVEFGLHRSPKRPKTVLSGGRLREMTWWSQTNFFRDHLYHCYGFYLDRLDTPSSFSLTSENQLIFCFWAIFDTKFSRYHQFEGTSSLSSVFVQLNSGSIMKKL